MDPRLRSALILEIAGGLLLTLDVLGPHAERLERASVSMAEWVRPSRWGRELWRHPGEVLLFVGAVGLSLFQSAMLAPDLVQTTPMRIMVGIFSASYLVALLLAVKAFRDPEWVDGLRNGAASTSEKALVAVAFLIIGISALPLLLIGALVALVYLAIFLAFALLVGPLRWSHAIKKRYGLPSALRLLGFVLFALGSGIQLFFALSTD